MPRVRAGDVELGYEILGPEDGEPVVFIQGLGGVKEGWRFQVPAVSEHFKVLLFDNRGVGESDKPDHQYSIPMFASDLSHLLAAIGWDSAHIIGGSMGGMIAQEFVLGFPYKVRSLTLLYTTPGGNKAVPPRQEVMALWAGRDSMTPEEAERLGAELGYSKGFRDANPELLEELIADSIKQRPADYVFLRHLEAAMKHDAVSRLRWISVPTLLAHGTDDWLLPHENSERLANLIPNARLELFDGAGHALGIEYQDELNRLLIDWVRSNSS